MTSLNRVMTYIDFGFSAGRVSELLGWPLQEVRELKAAGPRGLKISEAVHMVLRGSTPETAAQKVGIPVAEVAAAVGKARLDIGRLAKASN